MSTRSVTIHIPENNETVRRRYPRNSLISDIKNSIQTEFDLMKGKIVYYEENEPVDVVSGSLSDYSTDFELHFVNGK